MSLNSSRINWIEHNPPPPPPPSYTLETPEFKIRVWSNNDRWYYSIWWKETTINMSSRFGYNDLEECQQIALEKAESENI